MSTLKQKRLAKALIQEMTEPTGKTGYELLINTGYAPTTATSETGEIIESKGVKEALRREGISIDEADKVVNKILHKGREMNRLTAAGLIYKRLGGFAPEKRTIMTVNVTDEVKERLDKLLADAM